MTIYERIRSLRESKGMSQEDLALLVGYKSRSAINKIESGIRDINQSQIIAFANALGTTPGYLMGWADKEPIESVDDLIEDFPEGIRMIRRASKELSPKDRERLIKIMKSYLDQEDGE